jgi:Pectinacetylesterase
MRHGLILVLTLLLLAPLAQAAGWQRITDPAETVGIDGRRHKASCSAYPGTDPRFSFWTREGRSRNLVIYFEGGGACWDNLTCSNPVAGLPEEVPQFFVPQVPPGTDPAQSDGLLREHPNNPVSDWDAVYIPYCTGDIHIGSATQTYTSIGHPVLPLPAGTPLQIQHRGYDNFMVVLEHVRRQFKRPGKVLVAGSSAGGYGATFHAPWVNLAYPLSKLYVMADASQGVTTAAFDTGRPGRGNWNEQLAPWVFGRTPPAGKEVMARVASRMPLARFAQFTTPFDVVQFSFYGLMKQFYGPGGSCPNPVADWNQQMLSQLADTARQRNVRHYVAAGQYHTILRSPLFYSEASAGPVFADWLGDMLDSSPWTFWKPTPDWRNVACPTCLQPAPCQ